MLREPFLKAVEFAAKAVPSRISNPLQECLHLKSSNGRMTITSGGSEIAARSECECDIDMDCCVAAARLLRNLTSATEDEITIIPEDDRIILKAGTSRATIETLPSKDFPAWDEVKGRRFIIPSDAIKRCLPAVSVEENRHTLQCVYLDTDGYAVGADGRRMHCVTLDDKPPVNTMIPTVAATMLSGLEGVMSCDERRFHAEGDGWALTGKVIEGNYPTWKAMKMATNEMMPPPENLAASVKRASVCSDDKNCERVDFERGRISTRGYEDDLDMDVGFPFGMAPSRMISAIKEAGDGFKIAGTVNGRAIAIENGPFLAILAIMSPIA